VELVPFGTLRWGLVGSLISNNRPREALESIEQIHSQFLKVGAGWHLHWEMYTASLHILGEHQRELDLSREARDYISGPLYAMAYEGQALAALNRLDELAMLVDDVLFAAPQPALGKGSVLVAIAEEVRAHGNRAQSFEIVDRALEWYDEQTEEYQATAAGRLLRGQLFYLREMWDEAASILTALASDSTDLVSSLGFEGAIAARLGDTARARSIMEELAEIPRDSALGRNTLWRARITALLADREEAVALLRRAFAEGRPYGLWLHRDMDFESLNDYPPFQELMRPKG
jgi:tetratricopeptide (TPR) repeat protein